MTTFSRLVFSLFQSANRNRIGIGEGIDSETISLCDSIKSPATAIIFSMKRAFNKDKGIYGEFLAVFYYAVKNPFQSRLTNLINSAHSR